MHLGALRVPTAAQALDRWSGRDRFSRLRGISLSDQVPGCEARSDLEEIRYAVRGGFNGRYALVIYNSSYKAVPPGN